MKIVLVNYRYFISGGPERYLFNIKELLERMGHEVVVFSVKSSKNVESEWSDYFIESVGDEEYFAKTRKSPANVVKSFSRMYYSPEAKRKFARLLKDTSPDIVYILQYHNKISPSFISVAKKMGIPVVHRISDFQYMCPNALFYNERTGVCEDCLKGRSWSCVRNRCVMNSALLSAIKLGAKRFHEFIGVTDKIDRFVVPSSFTVGKLKEYGLPETRLCHVPTFFNQKSVHSSPSYEPFFLYIGRIEPQKGLQTLVNAFIDTDINLKIIGFSQDDYDLRLKQSLSEKKHNIEFLGKLSFAEIEPYLNSCLCTIVPSEWYDNFPNSILESFAFKKAVIATDFGSLPELVKNNVTGLTFPYADVDALRKCVRYMLDNPAEAKRMGDEAFRLLSEKLSPERHYDALIEIFNSVIRTSNNRNISE